MSGKRARCSFDDANKRRYRGGSLNCELVDSCFDAPCFDRNAKNLNNELCEGQIGNRRNFVELCENLLILFLSAFTRLFHRSSSVL